MITVIICLIKAELYVSHIKINFNTKIRPAGTNAHEEKLRKTWVFLYLSACLSIGYLTKTQRESNLTDSFLKKPLHFPIKPMVHCSSRTREWVPLSTSPSVYRSLNCVQALFWQRRLYIYISWQNALAQIKSVDTDPCSLQKTKRSNGMRLSMYGAFNFVAGK